MTHRRNISKNVKPNNFVIGEMKWARLWCVHNLPDNWNISLRQSVGSQMRCGIYPRSGKTLKKTRTMCKGSSLRNVDEGFYCLYCHWNCDIKIKVRQKYWSTSKSIRILAARGFIAALTCRRPFNYFCKILYCILLAHSPFRLLYFCTIIKQYHI